MLFRLFLQDKIVPMILILNSSCVISSLVLFMLRNQSIGYLFMLETKTKVLDKIEDVIENINVKSYSQRYFCNKPSDI